MQTLKLKTSRNNSILQQIMQSTEKIIDSSNFQMHILTGHPQWMGQKELQRNSELDLVDL